jgi:hypothetical protein
MQDSAAYYDVPPECDGCIEWALLNRRLAPLVGLPLHEVHAVPPPSGESFLREPEEARLARARGGAGRAPGNYTSRFYERMCVRRLRWLLDSLFMVSLR